MTSVGPVTVSRDTNSGDLFQFFDCGVGCADTAYIFWNPLQVSGAYTIDVLLDLLDANGAVASTVSSTPFNLLMKPQTPNPKPQTLNVEARSPPRSSEHPKH